MTTKKMMGLLAIAAPLMATQASAEFTGSLTADYATMYEFRGANQGDNLVEAVELYEAVLTARDRHADPLGRARVLANQGNVLAHLGAFDQAKAKLYEARFLFEELGDHDSVRTVRGVLDEIARQGALDRTESDAE